jgi:hypothetical protein
MFENQQVPAIFFLQFCFDLAYTVTVPAKMIMKKIRYQKQQEKSSS